MTTKTETEIVMDTSVLLDILVRSRPRHRFAKLIGAYLIENGVKVMVPMHGMFEIRAAMLNAKMQAADKGERLPLNEDIGESTPLNIHPVAIDDAFFAKYFDAKIPYLNGGNYPYVALAKAEGLILLTEDAEQYQAAMLCGVQVYNEIDFRDKCIAKLG